MRYLILLLLLSYGFCGEAEKKDPPLSPTVTRALDSYYSKLATEKQKYLAAAMKVQQELRKTLDVEMKALTQKGNLEGAMAVKAKIDELEKEMVTEDPLMGLLPPGTLEKFANQKPSLNTVLTANSWRRSDGIIISFAKEGTMETNLGHKGTWVADSKNQDTIIVTWPGNVIESYQVKDATLVCMSGSAKGYVATPAAKSDK